MSRRLPHGLRNPTLALSLLTELMEDAGGADRGGIPSRIRRALSAGCWSCSTAPFPAPPPGGGGAARRSAISLDLAGALEPRLPAVTGVEEQPEHALVNLGLNSREPSGPGAATVRVAESRGNRVMLVATGHGPGVAEVVRDRLFERWSQPRACRSRSWAETTPWSTAE